MPSKWRRFLREVDLFSYWLVHGHPMPQPKVPGTPQSSHKRSLSLGSNSGGETPIKKPDNKTTPVKPGKMSASDNSASASTSSLSGQQQAPSGPINLPSGAKGSAAAATSDLPQLNRVEISSLPTYVEKAKEGEAKKPTTTFPWALYVFGGSEGQSPVSSKHFWAFHKHTIQKWKELPAQEKKWVMCEFVDYKDTFGVIAAADRYSAMWYKQLASTFVYEGIMTRAFNRWERVETRVFSVWLKGKTWRTLHGSSVLDAALELVDLDKFTYANLNWDLRNPKGAHLSFEPEPNLAKELDKLPFVNFGGQLMRFKTRTRNSITEKQWFATLGYQEDLMGSLAIDDNDDGTDEEPLD